MPVALQRSPVPAHARFVSWQPPVQPANPRALKIGLLGIPNSGKSSLLNRLVELPLAAVSPKVNTTRSEIRGILTKHNVQLTFLDEPGIIPSHKQTVVCKDLVKKAWKGYEEADVVCLVVDAMKKPTLELVEVIRAIAPQKPVQSVFLDSRGADDSLGNMLSISQMRNAGIPADIYERRNYIRGLIDHSESNFIESENRKEENIYDENQTSEQDIELEERKLPPAILVLNKVDLASDRKWVKQRASELECHGDFDSTFFTSALDGRGTAKLLWHLLGLSRPRTWLFPTEMRTTLPKTKQIEEVLKSYIMCWFNKDVPYKVQQETIGWVEQSQGPLLIEQEFHVKDDDIARMICGYRNRLLFQMRKHASRRLSYLWGRPVVVYIHVKPDKIKNKKIPYDYTKLHPSDVHVK